SPGGSSTSTIFPMGSFSSAAMPVARDFADAGRPGSSPPVTGIATFSLMAFEIPRRYSVGQNLVIEPAGPVSVIENVTYPVFCAELSGARRNSRPGGGVQAARPANATINIVERLLRITPHSGERRPGAQVDQRYQKRQPRTSA